MIQSFDVPEDNAELYCLASELKPFYSHIRTYLFQWEATVMASTYPRIEVNDTNQEVWTLAGRLRSYSTEELHIHSHHQILTIRDGVSLLVDEIRKQPLFGTMTAFIPAQLPHRSIVIGEAIRYKSIYLAPQLFTPAESEISIFTASTLGAALLDRIEVHQQEDICRGLNRECLELLLKVLPEDMSRPQNLVRLPEPQQALTREMIEFIEIHYSKRLTMADFTTAFAYSERHLSRLFKADLKIAIFEYLRLYRILMASIDLHNPARAITEIAFNCGYESLSSFYRDFKLIFALTPKAFREHLSSRCGR